jgi:DGQHR domain-containing protein
LAIVVDCLRTEHRENGKRHPIFIGFMTAKQLDGIAVAPHFELTTEHFEIAENANSVPVRQWQRPVDRARVTEIARIFRTSTEIMPNAVLLAAPKPELISLSSQGLGNLWRLEVPDQKQKPLWILDGQHRIAGLAEGNVDGDIPFVLLASHDQSAPYQDSTFAKIFAQVTTTAEGLHPLHNETLTFAFGLGDYDATNPVSGGVNAWHHEAMKAVVELCTQRFLDTGRTQQNPFFNRIAFNPKSTKRSAASPLTGPIQGGFQTDAIIMEDFFFSSYFGSKSLPAGRLSPRVLATQVAKAYEALVACHPPASRSASVLLTAAGTAGATGHKALQDGFIHGILRYLAEHGVPKDWGAVLTARGFDTTNWSSTVWAANRTGSQQTVNKNIARRTFVELLGKNVNALFLPTVAVPNPLNLAHYFSGSLGAGIEVHGRRLSDKGRKLKVNNTDPVAHIESGGTVVTMNLGSLRTVALGKVTPNVQEVSVKDQARPYDADWSYQKVRTGLTLEPHMLHSNPLNVDFDITFYGGQHKVFTLELFYT